MSRSTGVGVLSEMSFLRPVLPVLPLAILAALIVAGAPACNGSLATVLSSDAGPDPRDGAAGDGGDDPSHDGGAPGCVDHGGLCIGKSLPPAGYHVATRDEGVCSPGAVCYMPDPSPGGTSCVADQDCNGDAAVSSLMGSCFHGVCMCNAPYFVQATGKCAKAPPADCILQKSATCRQLPPECLADELRGNAEENASCGDLVEATCCTKTAACKGPVTGGVAVDFACCSKKSGAQPPVCVNGWQTCTAGDSAILKSDTCN